MYNNKVIVHSTASRVVIYDIKNPHMLYNLDLNGFIMTKCNNLNSDAQFPSWV